MKLAQMMLGAIPLLVAGACLATTSAQAIGLGWLWANGKLSEEKMVRYAAVIYGIDLSEVPLQGEEKDQSHDELLTHEEVLDARVRQSELLQGRSEAVAKGTDNIRILFGNVRSDNERYAQMKSRFDAHLAQLEVDARAAAIEEVQRTLEVLRAKQAKELILRMLEDRGNAAEDDVLQDVVTMIKAMPKDKRRKILGEFRTEEEREQLHEILLEIGELTEDE